jgi:hypothetical protein
VNQLDERLGHAAVAVRDLVAREVVTPRPPARRPRVALIAVVALATTAAVVLPLTLVGSRQSTHRVVASGALAPTSIVAWRNFDAVVMSRTGRVVRTLDTNIGLYRHSPTFAVTPDGKTVYYTRARAARPGECTAGGVEEIARVAVSGGKPESVTPGVVPAISPDGGLLAYVRNATNRCNPDFNELVVRDLSSGKERSWRWAGLTGPDLGSFLSWAPDGRHLGFDAVGASADPRLLDTARVSSLDDATPIPHALGTTWSGFLGTTGASIGARPWSGQGLSTPVDVLELDGSTGAVRRVLFTLPGSLATGNAFDASEGLIRSDASGRHLLAVGVGDGGTGILYRWSEGETAPTAVAHKADSAAWVPTRTHMTAGPHPGAQALCAAAFGKAVVEAAATTVGDVRASGIGIVGRVFRNAFPGVADDSFAAWCMVETPARHCYDESAVSADGSKVHIAGAGCGWPAGPPPAGPAYWTF